MRGLETDCTIVGGGPAGSLLAATLAGWGRRVVLIERGGHARPMPEETVVPTAEPLLSRLGLLELFRELEGPREQGTLWGGPRPRWRDPSDAARGYQVAREVFDRELSSLATDRGVRVVEGSAVGPIDSEQGVCVRLVDGSRVVARAPVVAAASGSATTDGLVPHRVEAELSSTIALTDRAPGGEGDPALIEAVPEGWIWWLPLRAGDVSVTLFADRDELLERGRDALWRSAFENAVGPARGTPARHPRGTDATSRLRRSLSDVLLVGDAASTIDPLSSQGLEKALASGEAAAFAVNTILADPERAARVRAGHHAWEHGLFHAHERRTRAFYREETRFAASPFWVRRRAVPDDAPGELPERVVRSPRLEDFPKLERRDRLLVDVPGFRLSGGVEVLDRVGAVAIAPLLELLDGPTTAVEAVDRAARHPDFVALSPRAVTDALSELYRRGFLVPA